MPAAGPWTIDHYGQSGAKAKLRRTSGQIWLGKGFALRQREKKQSLSRSRIISHEQVNALEEKLMRMVKIAFPSLFVVGGFLLCTSAIYGTQAYAKKEKKSCTFCHAKSVSDKAEMNKNLKATGTCYKENEHSLAKCAPAK